MPKSKPMKKILVVAGISIVTMIAASSCGSNPRKDTNNPAQDSMPAGATTGSSRPDNSQGNNPRGSMNDDAYTQGAVLIANNDCKTCHAIDKKLVGPSYNMIADKYENSPGMRDELAYKINHGGSGRWGNVAMPAHPQVSIPNGNLMAAYILSLKSK